MSNSRLVLTGIQCQWGLTNLSSPLLPLPRRTGQSDPCRTDVPHQSRASRHADPFLCPIDNPHRFRLTDIPTLVGTTRQVGSCQTHATDLPILTRSIQRDMPSQRHTGPQRLIASVRAKRHTAPSLISPCPIDIPLQSMPYRFYRLVYPHQFGSKATYPGEPFRRYATLPVVTKPVSPTCRTKPISVQADSTSQSQSRQTDSSRG